jgi:methyltransferase-like protein
VRLDDLPPQVQQTVRDISPDLIHIEQYLDFLRKRTFRRTLLCHASIPLSRAPTMEQVLGMSTSALAWPLEDQDANSETIRFRTAINQVITTNHPLAKAIFYRLWELHPQSIPIAELIAEVRAGLDRRAKPFSDQDFAALLVQCFLSNSLMFHVHPPRFMSELSHKPCASTFCRAQARLSAVVTNQWHRQIELNELDRHVLVRLDGQHDRQRLVEEIGQLVADNTLTDEVLQAAAPQVSWPPVGGELGGVIDVSLQRLLTHALLIA